MSVQEEVFGFFIPSVTLMGVSSCGEIGDQVKALGSRKPFICTDRGIVDAGISDRIVARIHEACGAEAVVYEGLRPNPLHTNVQEGLGIYRKHRCDMILSLGGGSAHDCGKRIGIVATNGGSIGDYGGIDRSIETMPNFISFMIRPLAMRT